MWRRKWDRMPEEFEILATYNAEVSRGLVHRPEWVKGMNQLQMEFNAWRDDQIAKDSATHKAGRPTDGR